MRQVFVWACVVIVIGGVARAQSPGIVYSWEGVPSATMGWQSFDQVLGNGYNRASLSAATGDLVVTETADGTGGTVVGGPYWILDSYNRPREDAPAKGNLDVTGIPYMEIDLQHNSPTASVDVGFFLHLYTGSGAVDSHSGGSNGMLDGPGWTLGPGVHTIRYPLSQLPPRLQTSVGAIILTVGAHEAIGNLTWTISQVRTVGAPLTYRDIVTNNAGSPDDGIDGAFPLNTSDMSAIVGNTGIVSQLGLSRNPAGSLQWTDKGGTGEIGSESGASIGWGNGAGWRNFQPGIPTAGNSYNERIADFSNYDRMTVRISALDTVNPTGTVGITAPFMMMDPTEDGAPPPTVLPSQDLTTNGQYYDLVYDLSSVSFLKTIWHWGLDVAAHPNNIAFNIDNIRLWNSATPPGVAGDYNGNGMVDAADYVLWRKGSALLNEGATPGSNTPEDYTFWRSRLGATSGSGATFGTTVPEPSGVVLLVTAVAHLWAVQKVRRQFNPQFPWLACTHRYEVE